MNVSELGLVTPAGKVVWGKIFHSICHCYKLCCQDFSFAICLWDCSYSINFCISDPWVVFTGKYAQVTNNPENDGCVNAVLLV